MKMLGLFSMAALAAGVALVTSSPSAQSAALGSGGAKAPAEAKAKPVVSTGITAATFAAPVRLTAGDKLMGENRLYPSPVLQDMNGDGLADIVIGDLFGKVTVAHRVAGEGPAKFSAETTLNNFEGKELKFKNW